MFVTSFPYYILVLKQLGSSVIVIPVVCFNIGYFLLPIFNLESLLHPPTPCEQAFNSVPGTGTVYHILQSSVTVQFTVSNIQHICTDSNIVYTTHTKFCGFVS